MAADPQTYSELQASLQNWTDDSTLTATIPEIIALSERRLSRRLNSPEMEALTTLAITDGAASLPSDLLEIRSLFIDYQNRRTQLTAISEADYDQAYASDYTSLPRFYAVSGSSVMVFPLPDLTYGLTLRYKQAIPALSDINTTNWLLTKWPDLYLAHCLLVASDFGYEDARLDWATTKTEQLISEVNDAGRKLRYGSGPLIPRPPVTDIAGRLGR